jgi:hypothetical protein
MFWLTVEFIVGRTCSRHSLWELKRWASDVFIFLRWLLQGDPEWNEHSALCGVKLNETCD